SMATVSRGRMPIAYSTTTPSHVSLKVYDGMGRLVQTLVNAQQPAGEKSVYWDNKDLSNRTVSNGVYFLKLEADNQAAVHKLILVR
ncbi:MAG: FlgD immunoglobulin-like domain containing protein, partial [candidate division WOR-3 bacterium]